MNKIKKLAVTLLVLFMLVPTFAFAQEVKETPELKAKIQNIVNTMPEDDAIEAIENLFGENDRPHFATRSASNFAIYKTASNDRSMADNAFTEESNVKIVDGKAIFTLYTQPIYYLNHQADVTGITIITNTKKVYNAERYGEKAPAARYGDPNDMVPVKLIFSIPLKEADKSLVPGYDKSITVKFDTNLVDDFELNMEDVFPDKMGNPQARILFNIN